MAEFRYVREMLGSFGEVFRKPILLLPFVYIFVLSTIFLLITPTGWLNPDGTMNVQIYMVAMGLNVIQGIIAIVFRGMGLVGIRDYVDEKEVTHRNQVQGGLRIYWKLLALTLIWVALFLIPIIIGQLIYTGFSIISPLAGTISAVIMILLFVAFLLVLMYYLLFSTVIIAYEGKGVRAAITESYYYAKNNKSHTMSAFLTIIISSIVLILIVIILMIPFVFLERGIGTIIQGMITNLVSVFVYAVFTLFLFKAFNKGRGTVEPLKKTQVFDEKLMNVPPKHTLGKKTVKKKSKKK